MTSKPKGKPGRPSIKSEALTDTILDRLLVGESLRAVCREEGMPDLRTVLRWLLDDEEFARKYTRTREGQAEVMDYMIYDAALEVTPENAAAMRVKIDALKWRAMKLAPKKYGDKLDMNHGGSVTLKHDPEALAKWNAVNDRLAEKLRTAKESD